MKVIFSSWSAPYQQKTLTALNVSRRLISYRHLLDSKTAASGYIKTLVGTGVFPVAPAKKRKSR